MPIDLLIINFLVGKNKMRRHPHGFTLPIKILQLVAYFACFANLLIFYMLTVHVFTSSDATKIGVGVAYLILTLFMLAIKVIATRIDPSDPIYMKSIKLKEKGKEYSPQSSDLYCQKCDSFADKSSKHCNSCNR